MAGGAQGAGAPAQGQMGQGAAQPQGGGMPQQQQPQVNPQTIQDIQNMIQQYQSGQLGGAQRGFALGGFTGGSSPFGSGGFKGNSPVSAGYQQIQNNAMQGAQGSFADQNQQAQSNALGAIPAPAGGGQTNMMKPMPAPAGGPYDGFNAQGQSQGQPQSQDQAQFQTNMMRPVPMPQPQGQQGPMSVGAFSPQSPMGGFPQQPQGAGPDVTGNSPAAKMGYDQSGSDAGIGGQAVQGVQNPAGMGGQMSLAGGPYGGINPQTAGPMPVGNKPLSLSQLRPQQSGLQIAGNPSTQPVFNGRQRGMRR